MIMNRESRKMRGKILAGTILGLALLAVASFSPPCAADSEDYVAKKGLALYRGDLQNLLQQILALPPEAVDQREFLDRFFRMKFSEAEKMFEACGGGEGTRRGIAEIYLLKAVENRSVGDWIQAYAALLDARKWSKDVARQVLRVGEREISMGEFSSSLEQEVGARGQEVRFVIKPFPEDRMFRPENVVLARSQGEEEPRVRTVKHRARRPSAGPEAGVYGKAQAGQEEGETGPVEISERDKAFLLKRFTRSLYAYYYDPTEANAQFSLYLPRGSYYIYEKDFSIHPVEFSVTDEATQVVLRPARWFRMAVSEQVHPAKVSLSFHGKVWKDLDHVPFGRYRIHVKSKEYTAPMVKVTFVPKGEESSDEDDGARRPGARIVVEDRGVYKLALRERTGSEKLRYDLFGY